MWYLRDKGISTQNEILDMMLDLEMNKKLEALDTK
jgi:hypothetical protein